MYVHLLFHSLAFLTQNQRQKTPTMTEFGYFWQCVQVQNNERAQTSTTFKIAHVL